MSDCCSVGEQCCLPPVSLLRMQSWLSPAFPTGSYSYSHGIEWAVEAGHIHDRESLVDWLEADLRYGSGRNEATFFIEAWRSAADDDCEKLLEIAELAAAPFARTSEFALETSQQATACLATLRRVWPDPLIESLSELLLGPPKLRRSFRQMRVLGVRAVPGSAIFPRPWPQMPAFPAKAISPILVTASPFAWFP